MLEWQKINSHNIGLHTLPALPGKGKLQDGVHADCTTDTLSSKFWTMWGDHSSRLIMKSQAPCQLFGTDDFEAPCTYECLEEVGFRRPGSKQGSWQEDQGYLMCSIHPGSLWLRLWERGLQ